MAKKIIQAMKLCWYIIWVTFKYIAYEEFMLNV